MIFIDSRTGSGDLLPLLDGLGVPCSMVALEYGDIAFVGRGLNESPVMVGVEIKTLSDLIGSLTSGRLVGHQLPGMVLTYQQPWLLVEGTWIADPKTNQIMTRNWDGQFTTYRAGDKTYLYDELDAYLLTLQIRGGVMLARTPKRAETARWIATLHRWWTEKPLAEHRAHLTLYNPNAKHRDTALLTKPSLVRRMASELPGVGWVRSGEVAKHFPSVKALANATVKEWTAIEGIGKLLAKRITKEIGNESETQVKGSTTRE